MGKLNYPLVSVIVNCLNGEKFVKAAIDSVYQQTYENWEIIFWDNASTDNTRDIIKNFDERLRYFRSRKTLVLGKARAKATKKAKGDYLAFLDADDYWSEDKLLKQINIFLRSKDTLGFVYGKSDIVFTGFRKKPFVWSQYQFPYTGDVFYKLIESNFVVFSSLIVDRRKFFACGGFPVDFLNSTDYYVLVHLAKSYKCAFLDEVCCYYRVHSDNLSKRQKAVSILEAIKVCSEFLPDKLIEKALKNRYADLALVYARDFRIFNAIQVVFQKRCFINLLLLIINRSYRKIFA